MDRRRGKTRMSSHAPQPLRWQFSLASFLLSVTFVAACVGVIRIQFEIGCFLVVFFGVPAFVRTAVICVQASRYRAPLTIPQRLGEMFFSILVMVPVFCAGVVAGCAGFGFGRFFAD